MLGAPGKKVHSSRFVLRPSMQRWSSYQRQDIAPGGIFQIGSYDDAKWFAIGRE